MWITNALKTCAGRPIGSTKVHVNYDLPQRLDRILDIFECLLFASSWRNTDRGGARKIVSA